MNAVSYCIAKSIMQPSGIIPFFCNKKTHKRQDFESALLKKNAITLQTIIIKKTSAWPWWKQPSPEPEKGFGKVGNNQFMIVLY